MSAWPIRIRLTAGYLAVLALATVLLAGGGWWLLRRSVFDAADSHLRARIDGVSRFIDNVQRELPREEVADEFHEYAQLTPGRTLLEVVDDAGTVLCTPVFTGWRQLVDGVDGTANVTEPASSTHARRLPYRVAATARRWPVVPACCGRADGRRDPGPLALCCYRQIVPAVLCSRPALLDLPAALAPVDRMTRPVRGSPRAP